MFLRCTHPHPGFVTSKRFFPTAPSVLIPQSRAKSFCSESIINLKVHELRKLGDWQNCSYFLRSTFLVNLMKTFLDQKDAQIENGVFYCLAANYLSTAKFLCHVANVMFTGFEVSPNITPNIQQHNPFFKFIPLFQHNLKNKETILTLKPSKSQVCITIYLSHMLSWLACLISKYSVCSPFPTRSVL